MSRHAYRNEGLYSTGAQRMAIGMNILENEYSNISIGHWLEMYEAEQENKNVDNRTEGVSYLGQIVNKIQSDNVAISMARPWLGFRLWCSLTS